VFLSIHLRLCLLVFRSLQSSEKRLLPQLSTLIAVLILELLLQESQQNDATFLCWSQVELNPEFVINSITEVCDLPCWKGGLDNLSMGDPTPNQRLNVLPTPRDITRKWHCAEVHHGTALAMVGPIVKILYLNSMCFTVSERHLGQGKTNIYWVHTMAIKCFIIMVA
jgi:hypothetical protein